MYIFALFFPLVSSLLTGFLGFYFGRQGCSFIACLSLGFSLLISLFIAYEVILCQCPVFIFLWTWASLDICVISISMLFDSLTAIMFVLVTGISFLIHLYSVSYMNFDPHLSRFLSYLSVFTFFMLFLVSSANFIQFFIGWEGVGLCSYLLINFWYSRVLANKAALKALIINRLADIFFFFGIILIFLTFKTTDFIIVFDLTPFFIDDNLFFFNFLVSTVNLVSFFLFIGGLGKSAQIFFHTWLPDAMEGPTPVSALLHAATMVTAGVFLLIRCSPIFEYAPTVLFFVSLFGGLTAFFFSIVAVFQYDLKKVIAYSTCSQLGYMFFSCGLSNYQVSFFHLFNHAFFKALLFLSAGSIIHAFGDEQDMRSMGCLVNLLPFTYLCILVGFLSIIGFPFLTGFYSKDIILELAFSRLLVDGFFIYFLGIFTAFFTAIYSLRLLLFVFFFKPNMYFSLIFFIKDII